MRDLEKDLELCNSATPGPWDMEGCGDIYVDGTRDGYVIRAMGRYLERAFGFSREDARFISEARSGWPEAIRRAMNAEVKVKKLSGLLDRILCVCAEANLTADSFSESDCRALLRRIDEAWREVQLALQEDEKNE